MKNTCESDSKGIRFPFCKIWLAVFVLGFFFWSCEKDNKKQTEISAVTKKVNNFIYERFQLAYLWNKYIPSGIKPDEEPDPFDLFDKMKYDTYDEWSYLTDDAEALFKEYEGISTTYGLRFLFVRFSGTDTYFSVVRFVYPNSPAQEAGVKRGDIIIQINNNNITRDNYLDLYYSSSITLHMGTYSTGGIGPSGRSVTMQSREMYLDPVHTSKVIEKGNHRIGYLCYTDYVVESHDKLVEVFSDFKSRNVTDVVLDLRYNPGGAATSAQYLSSILAPRSALYNKSIFLQEIWNDDYMWFFKRNGEDRNEYFNTAVGVNMDLSRLYVLTSDGTASASEATIVGLDPYLELIRIGTTTHGKYCGASLLQAWIDEDFNVDEDIANWAMALVVYKFANSKGYTDFKDGLSPDYEVKDEWYDYKPIGDESDPALAKAIELITGQAVPARSKAVPDVPYKLAPGMNDNRGGMIRTTGY